MFIPVKEYDRPQVGDIIIYKTQTIHQDMGYIYDIDVYNGHKGVLFCEVYWFMDENKTTETNITIQNMPNSFYCPIKK
jgi:hypothetical protein